MIFTANNLHVIFIYIFGALLYWVESLQGISNK